jgi:hypothetical protein
MLLIVLSCPFYGVTPERFNSSLGHGGRGSVRSRGKDGVDTQSANQIDALRGTRQRFSGMQ